MNGLPELGALRSELRLAGVFEHHETRSWLKLGVLATVVAACLVSIYLFGWVAAIPAIPVAAVFCTSIAMLGDVIIAEPDALIVFAGPRVIEQTIRQQLPPGFQRSEFLLEHGMVDMVVPRPKLKAALERVLRWFDASATPAPLRS